MMQTKQSAI